MKLLIATSGGIDSAVLLYETLRDTRHDVIALRVPEDSYYRGLSPAFFARERAAFWAVCNWCVNNVRSFDAREGDVVTAAPNGTPYDPDRKLPIRPGLEETMETYWAECRYGSVGYNAVQLNVDEVWWGLTIWNNRLCGRHHKIHIDAFENWSGMKFIAPWIAPGTLLGARQGRSKLSVLNAAPPALRSLSSACMRPPRKNDCACKGCDVRRFYDLIYAPHEEHRDAIEDHLNRLARIGPYVNQDIPQDYTSTAIHSIVQNLSGWREWLEGR